MKPDEYKVRYLKYPDVFRRLWCGEGIHHSKASFPTSRCGISNIRFEKDTDRLKIHHKTFEKLGESGKATNAEHARIH